jgi:multiple sugar transport system permease protein
MVAMMLPTTIGNMGILLNIYRFGLTNKLFIFILPAMATPLTVFFMRMYLQSSFSKEMVQSARIDGAGEFRIFNQIILPLMKPALATQAIFAFAASWTDSEIPSLTIAQMEKKTIPMMFNPIYYLDVNDFLVVLALALPPIILYAFLSKFIVEGIALGGLKE